MSLNSKDYLIRTKFLAAVALLILIVAAVLEAGGLSNSSQTQFEFVFDVQSYTDLLAAADPNLRLVLYLDSLFIMAYASAISFAAIGFAAKSAPIAWFCGVGIIGIAFLDIWENFIMVQSMDMVASGITISADRILHQVEVSSLKWHTSAVVLFAFSFLLPSTRRVELLLVWGTRLGLTFAVPLFVFNTFEAREISGLLLLVSMAGGLGLLSYIAAKNAQT